MGELPPAVFQNPKIVLIALIAAFLSFIVGILVSKSNKTTHKNIWNTLLLVSDAVGLGAFTILGIRCVQEQYGYNNPALLLFVGVITGVGGGVILNGEILSGSKGAAGEIGHIKVEAEESDTCGCGGHGCLEQYASATGIVRMAKKYMKPDSVITNCEQLSAKSIFDGAKAGDSYCMEIVERFGKYLGTALANVSCVVDPEVIVIGGGVSRAGQIILDVVEKWYNEKSMFALKNKEFRLAELGNDAGIFGCVKMVMKK